MTFSSLCYPECRVAWPCPVTGSCNEPCVRQCPDSEMVIRPSPVVVTLPGPILSNFSQHNGMGAIGAPVVRPSFGGSLGLGGLYGHGSHYGGLYGLGGLYGYGGRYGYGGLLGHGGYCGYPGLYGYRGLWGYGGYGRRSGFGGSLGHGGLYGYGGPYGGLYGLGGYSGYGGCYGYGGLGGYLGGYGYGGLCGSGVSLHRYLSGSCGHHKEGLWCSYGSHSSVLRKIAENWSREGHDNR
ncbi:claw keratin-like [Dermochelys coriacea]|uniref:claw keratin-like n=1 Tax=Dermochelys coriacea TaxID=27794 RepID=UPI001CA91608|nr:claw keratin-like [Dermochelys coriacea]